MNRRVDLRRNEYAKAGAARERLYIDPKQWLSDEEYRRAIRAILLIYAMQEDERKKRKRYVK